MKQTHRLYFLLLAALFSIGTYSHALLKESVESQFKDFQHYYDNATLLRKGYNIWTLDKLSDTEKNEIESKTGIKPQGGQLHSTAFFACMQPFTYLPLRKAALLWLLLSQLLFAASIMLLLKATYTTAWSDDFFISLFLIFSFWPLVEQLHLGQPNFVTLFLLCSAMLLVKKNAFFRAGLVLALACTCREYLLVLALAGAWRHRRILTGILSGFVGIKLIATACFGGHNEHDYLFNKIVPLVLSNPHHYNNQSFAALLQRMAEPFASSAVIAMVTIALLLGLAAKTLAVTKKLAHDPLLEFSLLLTLACMLTPWLHEVHIMILLPAVILAWQRLRQINHAPYYRLAIASYLLMGLKYSLYGFTWTHSGIIALFTGGKVIGIALLHYVLLAIASNRRPLPESGKLSSNIPAQAT